MVSDLSPERLAELRRAAEEAERWRQRYDDGSPAGLAPMSLDPATVLALVAAAEEREVFLRAWCDLRDLIIKREGDYKETRATLARSNAALVDALETWTFDRGQQHIHTWHDRENWKERHAAAIQAAREAQADA